MFMDDTKLTGEDYLDTVFAEEGEEEVEPDDADLGDEAEEDDGEKEDLAVEEEEEL